MKTLSYRDNADLRNCFCEDCIKRSQLGCILQEPINCDIVERYLANRIADGYQIMVGKFVVVPEENKTIESLLGVLPKEIGVPPCASTLQIRFVDGMARVSYGSCGSPVERHLCMNEDVHKALENMVKQLMNQGEL